MANKLTLDQIFDTWCKCESPRHRNPMSSDTLTNHTCNTLILRQQFLQWVADEVVGKDILVVDVTLKENYIKKDAKNSLKEEQRQILKAHGWKES